MGKEATVRTETPHIEAFPQATVGVPGHQRCIVTKLDLFFGGLHQDRTVQDEASQGSSLITTTGQSITARRASGYGREDAALGPLSLLWWRKRQRLQWNSHVLNPERPADLCCSSSLPSCPRAVRSSGPLWPFSHPLPATSIKLWLKANLPVLL